MNKRKVLKIEKEKDIPDIEYKLAKLSGPSIDQYFIEDIEQGDYKNMKYADTIPAEMALPSDVRWREDLTWLRKGEKGKSKVWKYAMKN